jgi:general secretion pathway protein D
MLNQYTIRKRCFPFLLSLGISFLAVVDVSAQRGGFGGGGGGFGGGGGGGGGRGGSGSRTYPGNGTIGEAMISSDMESRRIVVITDDETSEAIDKVIKSLDRPKPQVFIKVVFMEVTHNNSRDIGVEGSFRRSINGGGSGMTGSISNMLGLATAGMGGNAPGEPVGQGLYQVLGQDFQVTLRAIEQNGTAEVLSRPSILTRNNQPATITVGQSVPLVTSTSFNTLTGNPINNITYRDVGIILRVTPFITSDGMVEMIVAPEISSLSAQAVTLSQGVQNPVIDTRSADTVVVTPDGQTVIIGGLMQTQKKEIQNKVPLLGDIPVLGNLFKRKTKGDVKTELLIFLTPYIVNQPSQLASMSKSERGNQVLSPKSFSDKELDKYLDGLPSREKAADSVPAKSGTGKNRR